MNKILSRNGYFEFNTKFTSKNAYYFDVEDEICAELFAASVINCAIDFETVDEVVPKIYKELYKYMIRFHKYLCVSDEYHKCVSLDMLHKCAMAEMAFHRIFDDSFRSTVKSLEMNGEVLYEIIHLEHYRVKMASSLKPEIRITDSVPTDLLIMYK